MGHSLSENMEKTNFFQVLMFLFGLPKKNMVLWHSWGSESTEVFIVELKKSSFLETDAKSIGIRSYSF
jgi:hypothetical protein